MPFLRDDGPPVSKETIQRARESLPLEFGFEAVNEKGREVLMVRVPKAKPDYLHDLAQVAFYVSLDTIRNTRDVLLIGHEKTARLEPQLLRDHIRAQAREDAGVVDQIRRQVSRDYGFTVIQSPSNYQRQALAMRVPKETVAEFTPDDVMQLRRVLESARARLEGCQYAYIVANRDFERLGRRVLLELVGMGAASAAAPEPAAPAPLPVATQPAAPSVPPSARAAFPATPTAAAQPSGPTALPTAFPGMAPPAPPPINSIARGQYAQPTPLPPPPGPVETTVTRSYEVVAKKAPEPAPAAAPAVPPAEVVVHDEYEIVTKAKPAPAPAPAVEVVEHEEYEIVSKPKPAEAPRPVAAPAHLGLQAAPDASVAVHDEYEIVSKPKPAEAPKPAAAQPKHLGLATAPDAEAQVHEEYEIVSKKAPPAPAAAAPAPTHAKGLHLSAADAESHGNDEYEVVSKKPTSTAQAEAPAMPEGPEPERKVQRMDKEFEIYSSKPKAPPAPAAPAPALHAPQPAAPARARTKEYEIMGGHSAPPAEPVHGLAHLKLPGPTMAPAPSALTQAAMPAPAPQPAAPSGPAPLPFLAHLPHTPSGGAPPAPANAATLAAPSVVAPSPAPPVAVRDDPRAITPRTVLPVPSADSGAAVIPKVTPAAPELMLAQRFKEHGYEVVEGLRAQGTVFAFAAHKPQGRRVLVKRATDFGPDEAVTLAQLVNALGADVCLVVADKLLPGTRLATWGTRLEVCTGVDAATMTF